MEPVEAVVERIAGESPFTGVVRVEVDGQLLMTRAFGLADRAYGAPNTADTRFGIASGTKGLTALTVLSLVHEGRLELSAPVRPFLGDDLPLIDPAVTVEQLLAHRSGIGDYLDEEQVAVDDFVLTVPAHELSSTEDYLAVLSGHPMRFEPGDRFSYCNGGYVVLALVAERAAGIAFQDLVVERVCRPAGMTGTGFLRSDERPADLAAGYLAVHGLRTNIFHLPVLGSGDGGIATTAADVSALWHALFAAEILPAALVAEAVRPRSEEAGGTRRYGLGFWLDASTSAVILEGCDAGVSFRSVHDPQRRLTLTVISNTTDGAWPLSRALEAWRSAPA